MAKVVSEKLEERRCTKCNRLLAKAVIGSGKLEIVCTNNKCATVNTWTADLVKETEGVCFSIRTIAE